MSAAEWMAERADGVPPALGARLQQLAAAERGAPLDIADELVRAGTRTLRAVLDMPPMTRAHALDVLAADALMTYAFEAGADDPNRIAQQADNAMKAVGQIATLSPEQQQPRAVSPDP